MLAEEAEVKFVVLESKIGPIKPRLRQLIMEPTNMDVVEAWEDVLDRRGVPYATVACYQKTKLKEIFLGYSIVTETPIETRKEHGKDTSPGAESEDDL